MTPEQKEIYRNNILLQLDTARAPMLGKTLFIGLTVGGFTDSSITEMESEIEYLIAKGWVAIERAAISAGVKRYKITADGIEYVEANL